MISLFRKLTLVGAIIANAAISFAQSADVKGSDTPPLLVRRCTDFSITGKGDNREWDKTSWAMLTKLDSGGKDHKSRFKIMYSEKGIYLLFNGTDEKITTKYDQDFSSIFNGDVFEAFYHPDPNKPVYFEYEINALEKELVLALGRANGKSTSWIPWHYRPNRSILKKVDLVGGKMEAGSDLQSWSAEVFFSYEILGLLPEVPPVSGTTWNANICRLDYDSGKMIKYSWSPAIKRSFHEIEAYRAIIFE